MRRDYGPDVLAEGATRPRRPEAPSIPAEPGLVVEEANGDFCGAVVWCEKHVVTLEDRFGQQRVFPLTKGGFLLEGRRVTLVRPAAGFVAAAPSPPGAAAWPARAAAGPAGAIPGPAGATPGPAGATPGPARTPSGSIAAPRPPAGAASRARVAKASRIYVEGRHDAELVEKIWGDDLRDLGVVVEYLAGVDHLPSIVAAFSPGPGRRLGVLVDHLVGRSKESRIAASVTSPHVLVVGHPFVDVWQAVKPAALGVSAWPDVPPGQPWKQGVLAALGWGSDTAAGWRRILASVTSYADLEPSLLGRVEELIDFVTAPGTE